MTTTLALTLYFSFLSGIVLWSSRKVRSSTDFIIGNRSLNFWLTAMAAHASDMSNWLFMAYPALIYVGGIFNAWVAIGLTLCMWLNWTFVARKLRTFTGKWKCATFSSFLHHRYNDKSGMLQLFSALFCFIFYIVYLSAGLTGLGLLGQTLLGANYNTCLLVGMFVVVFYVIFGGFITLAWIDLFQGLFLMLVICAVPLYVISAEGGWSHVFFQISVKDLAVGLMPTDTLSTIAMISMMLGWGLGYFGQPHIITKFMGINHPEDIHKSRNFGMAWMILSLSAATLVGLVGSEIFYLGIEDPQMLFIEMVKKYFSPFIVGLILCAVLGATINVMSSQLLILGSILTEDVYKLVCKNRSPSPKFLLNLTRVGVILAASFALGIAYLKFSSIYELVEYAWSGLGASFGTLTLVALYSHKTNRFGAVAAIITGGLVAGLWPYVDRHLAVHISPLLPGFACGMIAIFLVSYLTRDKE